MNNIVFYATDFFRTRIIAEDMTEGGLNQQILAMTPEQLSGGGVWVSVIPKVVLESAKEKMASTGLPVYKVISRRGELI